jgi:eukaryotic-like serine/threonine-protein kinase
VRSLGDSDPRHVGPYRLLAVLDADEMGPLLLGSGPDGRLVAVKLVSARLSADDGFPQRFAREVAALRQVSGLHTAPVVDAGPAETSPWLASEFLPGPSIQQMVERGILLGEGAVLLLAAGLVGALTELHRAGLVHRDLTPVNVLLTEDRVRVLDFGIVRAVDHDISQVVGSPEFMSPEQVSGQPATPASDVFSLGAVLHFAATGRSPFVGATRAETLAQVVRAQSDLSVSLPTSVRRLLAACLVMEPRQRPSLDELRAMIGPVPPGAPPWPPLVRSMIAEQHTEIARLLGGRFGPAQPNVNAPTTRIAPVVVPAAPPPRTMTASRRDKRWKPDKWAVASGAAVVLTLVFAIIMFNVLTPDRPIRANQSSSAASTETGSIVATTTTTTTTTQQALPGQVTGLAEKCMDIAGANSDNGTPVQLYECNGTDAQQWVFSPDGTVQSLGKCLDVRGGDTDDGAKVQIHDCNGTGAQQWTATSEGRIVNVASDKCLDVPDSETADGTQLVIWTCHGEDNQLWIPPA